MKFYKLHSDINTFKIYHKNHIISKQNRPQSSIDKIDYVMKHFDIFSERKLITAITTIGDITFEENENVDLSSLFSEEELKSIVIRFPEDSYNENYFEVRQKFLQWETDADLVKRLYKSRDEKQI